MDKMFTNLFLQIIFAGNLVIPYLCTTTDNSNLILTPYIKNGEFETAKVLSTVEPYPGYNYTSFSGYLTINEEYDSNLFFWFVQAQKDSKNAPIILMMAGGPGVSALQMAFIQTGPFSAGPNLTLISREISWISEFNILYVDFPIGAGFSYTKSSLGYAVTSKDVGNHGTAFLRQFFTLFSEYQANELYLAGECYSAMFSVEIGTKLLEENNQLNNPFKINFKGVIVLSALLDLPAMYYSAEILYNYGLVNERQKALLKQQEDLATSYVNKGNYAEADFIFRNLIRYTRNDLAMNLTGFEFFGNLLQTHTPVKNFAAFAVIDEFRKRMHIGNITFRSDLDSLGADFFMYNKSNLISLLNKNYKILLFNGQLDMVVPPLRHRQFLSNLKWDGTEEYYNADRIQWKVSNQDEEIAGYVMQSRNLVEVMVRNAGHFLPQDQPRAVFDCLKRFIYNKSFY